MKKAFTLVACVLILFLVGCGSPQVPDPSDIQTRGFILGNTNASDGRVPEEYFYYVQDSRTGLCFVTGRLSAESGQLSYVPCTDEVLALIQNPNASTNLLAASPGDISR